jgi:hypothetical protein
MLSQQQAQMVQLYLKFINIFYLSYLNFEKTPAMNQAMPLTNPGLTLDGVTVESPRPKAAIITIKIRSVIILFN